MKRTSKIQKWASENLMCIRNTTANDKKTKLAIYVCPFCNAGELSVGVHRDSAACTTITGKFTATRPFKEAMCFWGSWSEFAMKLDEELEKTYEELRQMN